MSDNGAADRPADPEDWTDDQWEDWFAEEVAPTDRWARLSKGWEAAKIYDEEYDDLPRPTSPIDRAALLVSPSPDDGLKQWAEAVFLPIGLPDEARSFSRLSQELKLDFHDSWTQAAAPAAEEAAGADEPAADEEPGDRIPDAPYPEEASGWGWQKWAAPIIVAGVIVGWLVVNSGGEEAAPEDPAASGATDEPSVVDDATDSGTAAAVDLGATVMVTDPERDFTDEEDLNNRGFPDNRIQSDPDPGNDITKFVFTRDPEGTDAAAIIYLAGDGRSLDSDETQSTTFGVRFFLDESLQFSIEHQQGSSHVSGAEDVTVTSEWLGPDVLQFWMTNFPAQAGYVIIADTFSRIPGDSGAIVQGDSAQVETDG